MQDLNSSACCYDLPVNMKPRSMKRLRVRLYREKEPSLCEAACRLVDLRDLLRQDMQEPDQEATKKSNQKESWGHQGGKAKVQGGLVY